MSFQTSILGSPTRRRRATTLLVLFGFVWLRLLAACQDNLGAVGTPSRLADDRAIAALIAGSWCGTTALGSTPESGGGSHAGVCLHCATGCHGGLSRRAAWTALIAIVALGFGAGFRRHNPVAAPDWASANRTRGPPPRPIGV